MSSRKKSAMGWTALVGITLLIWIVVFPIMEGYGLTHPSGLTFSRYIWQIQQSWPLFLPIIAYLIGSFQWGFFVHILWQWDPGNAQDRRG